MNKLLENYYAYRIKLLICLLLVTATCGVYWQVTNFDFVNCDDPNYVINNAHVQAGFTFESLKWTFTTFRVSNWHPLTWLSHMLDFKIYGLNPRGHHFTNLMFHLANSLLLFFVLQRMTGTLYRSAFVAALFALHPLHVESVAWVSERKDVLSTFWGMLAIGAYCRYVEKPGHILYLLVILFFSFSLLAKPMLVTLPFLLILLDFWPLKRFENINFSKLRRIKYFEFKVSLTYIYEKIPLFILSAISCVFTIIASLKTAMGSLEFLPLNSRIENAFISYTGYAVNMVWPFNLAFFYPYPISGIPLWKTSCSVLLVVGALYASVRLAKEYPYILVGLLWYLGTLIPVIGLVQVGGQARADRYTYIPLIGLFIVFTWGVSHLLQKWYHHKIILKVAAVMILAALAVRAYDQTGYWKNGITLAEHAINVTKSNFFAHMGLARIEYKRGNKKKADFHHKMAATINPKYVALEYANKGILLADNGELDKAIPFFKKALEIYPDFQLAYYNCGIVLAKKGQYEEAIKMLSGVSKENPYYSRAIKIRSFCIEKQGKVKSNY